ncbi:pep-cterm sorting domain-containing protein [Anaeramoeba ignava]|uniref:Pep-cterm sorting domain-containing protein n=1 Tax=Anaeramoeba ignava TaxID=1746090 RepID=A0A9Q0R8E7_ANAIG|nr:pep-cterm sorting domain-containing protein [Anaeramoeba ignava]
METYSNLEKLSNDLKNLFQNKKENYSDFEIICEQNQISFKTHKSILSSRSRYFRTLFNSKTEEFQENKLIIKDFSNLTISSILTYLYSGKIKIHFENVGEILYFSSKYLIDELVENCSNFIKNNLQFEIIADVLKLSETMNLNQLLNYSYQFILDNFQEFIKTPFFLQLEENHLHSILSHDEIQTNEFELFQSIIKWGKHKSNVNQDKQQLQNQISNILHQIRFIDFMEEEIRDALKENLLPNEISQKLIEFQRLQTGNDVNKIDQFIEQEKSLIFKTRFSLTSSEIMKDIKNINALRRWIHDNQFFSKMKKGFSAKRDGFDSKKWHSICDDKGKTLVIIQTKDNFIFGGFTQVGFFPKDKSKWGQFWSNPDRGYQIDSTAFIFSIRNDKGDRKPEKFQIRKDQEQFAIFSYSNYGPYFGFGYETDIGLSSNLRNGFSNFGQSYNLPNGIKFDTNEAKSYLAGSYDKWEVDELETYFI